jgi:hypothetical protein
MKMTELCYITDIRKRKFLKLLQQKSLAKELQEDILNMMLTKSDRYLSANELGNLVQVIPEDNPAYHKVALELKKVKEWEDKHPPVSYSYSTGVLLIKNAPKRS